MNYVLIDNEQQLAEAMPVLKDSSVIGLDTEFVSEDCFRPDLCLIQVSTFDQVYILDPKSIEDFQDFWQLFVHPTRTVIVHAGREEILFVFRHTGCQIPILFDVQIAAGILGGEYPASYANLLNLILGTNIDKGETRTDWRKRPLSKSQLEYAALDVLDLPRLHSLLEHQLSDAGRSHWMVDELKQRQQELIDVYQSESWHRIGGVQSMRGRQLAIVRELWKWRDRTAQQRDMPARRVLRDDLIVELARRGSADPKKIAGIRGLHYPGLQRILPDLARCIAAGLVAPEPILPGQTFTQRNRPPALLVQFLNAAMAYLCRCNRIASSIVGSTDDVRDLIAYWLNDKNNPEAELPHLLVGWRGELVGNPLYQFYAGQKALLVRDPLDEMPLELCDVPSRANCRVDGRTE